MRFPAAVLAVAMAVGGAGAYSVHERGVARKAQDENTALAASLKTTNAQIEQLTAKLNDLTAPKPEPVREARPATKPTARRSKVARRAAEDPRWKKVQSQLDEQGKAIESTRQDLTAAKTELGDSIARTHGELVVLQRKGEKNYFEFSINKSKQFTQHGSVGIKLKKANVKRQYADLELIVDDRTVQKKHVNIYEPAMFYSADSEQPVQVVINTIAKDYIRGYVVEPKYHKNELTASAGAQDSTAANTTVPRQKLAMPK
ncbi:MAG TPA: hypothetical protein VN577_15645 [Terriglobales bacterium]|nr:hypothetical protein [Terriglobales bacterium]